MIVDPILIQRPAPEGKKSFQLPFVISIMTVTAKMENTTIKLYITLKSKGDKMTNRDVAAAWYYGLALKVANFRSDGKSIFSYAMKIGEINEKGDRVVFDYRITGVSRTTSRHIALAVEVANIISLPDKIQSHFSKTVLL